jgi:hypothetical protein
MALNPHHNIILMAKNFIQLQSFGLVNEGSLKIFAHTCIQQL